MSAVEALNLIRKRIGVTNLPSDIVNDPVKFREAYRRERGVELSSSIIAGGFASLDVMHGGV